MMPLKDETGRRFGMLVALTHLGGGLWSCVCDCGRTCERFGSDLRKKVAKGKSCGCSRSSFQAAGKTTHGCSGVNAGPEYRAWKNIHVRCSNSKTHNFDNYGARGIHVCERWASFKAFMDDMGKKPSRKHSIERKDVNGPYSPENCVWATSAQQARNRTDNVFITFKGRTQCLSDWATEVGIGRCTIKRRLDAGWSIRRALTEPPDRKSWETRRGRH